MAFAFLSVSMTPQTNYFYLWRHQMTSTDSRKTNHSTSIFGILKYRTSKVFNVFGKKQGQKNTEDPFFGNPEDSINIIQEMKWTFLNILNMGSTSSGKHGMNIWY